MNNTNNGQPPQQFQPPAQQLTGENAATLNELELMLLQQQQQQQQQVGCAL